jgi:hypothetical protein
MGLGFAKPPKTVETIVVTIVATLPVDSDLFVSATASHIRRLAFSGGRFSRFERSEIFGEMRTIDSWRAAWPLVSID